MSYPDSRSQVGIKVKKHTVRICSHSRIGLVQSKQVIDSDHSGCWIKLKRLRTKFRVDPDGLCRLVERHLPWLILIQEAAWIENTCEIVVRGCDRSSGSTCGIRTWNIQKDLQAL